MNPSMEGNIYLGGKIIKVGVEGDYYIRSEEGPQGNFESLERDCGDYIEVLNVKGVIHNEPGFVMAAGGIPDELKIDGGISFSMPRPPTKIPKNRPEDHLEAELYMQGLREGAEFQKRSGVVIWKEEWEYGEDIREQPHMIKIEINMAPTTGLWKGLSPPKLQLQAAMAMEGSKSVKADHHRFFVQSHFDYDHTLLGCYSADFFLVTHFRGLLIKEPGMVAVIGGIPDELKINGGISFWFPAPVFKFPTKLIEDPNERHKFDCEEGMAKQVWSKALLQAYKKAVGISSSSSSVCEEAPNTDRHLLCTHIEVNLGKGEADTQQLCDSLWAILSHSIHQTIFTNEMEKSEGVKPTFDYQVDSTRDHFENFGICKQDLEYFAYKYYYMVRAVRKKPSYSCSINKQDDQEVEEPNPWAVEEPMPKRHRTVKSPKPR